MARRLRGETMAIETIRNCSVSIFCRPDGRVANTWASLGGGGGRFRSTKTSSPPQISQGKTATRGQLLYEGIIEGEAGIREESSTTSKADSRTEAIPSSDNRRRV